MSKKGSGGSAALARRRYHLKTRFGMTLDQFTDMFRKQNGVCAICFGFYGEPLTVDHDHRTGKVRALLCRWCNSLLGHAKDDPAVLTAAIEYLRVHSASK